MREKEYQLNAQIGSLESVLANLEEREEREARMRRENIMPPPDYYQRQHQRPRRTSMERRKHLRERNASGIQFLILFLIACALGFWLIFTGG